jgi:hypothetical protein
VTGKVITGKVITQKPFKWYSKRKWIIEFFLKTNGDVEIDGP